MSKLNPVKKFVEYFVLFLLLLATSSKAAVNNQIEMFLETPAPDQTITGVLFTRGWAVAPVGIVHVELYIDGNFLLEIPLGETRTEVGALYPSYPGSDTSGFNIGLFYSRFANGLHTATVRAIDANDDHKEVSNFFTITRFDTSAPNNFLRDPSKVDLTQATVSLDGNSILVKGMVVDGKSYTVRLEWNTTLQGLAISQVTSGSPSTVDVTGKWVGFWSSSALQLNGTFSADIVQKGTLLDGSISVPQIGMSDAQLKGSVQGNSFVFGDIDDRITFRGTLTGSSSASGSYVYTALDSGSWQGSLSSSTAACVDIEGRWNITEQVISHNCNYVEQTVQRRFYIVQNGCLIAGSDDAGGGFLGSVNANSFSMTGSRPDSGGVTTISSSQITVSADGSTLNGTASWTWSDGSDGCSGKSSITGSRTQQY